MKQSTKYIIFLCFVGSVIMVAGIFLYGDHPNYSVSKLGYTGLTIFLSGLIGIPILTVIANLIKK